MVLFSPANPWGRLLFFNDAVIAAAGWQYGEAVTGYEARGGGKPTQLLLPAVKGAPRLGPLSARPRNVHTRYDEFP